MRAYKAVITTFLAILVAVGLSEPSSARASLDGKSPVSTGCMNGSRPIWSGTIYNSKGRIGMIEVRYSPKCGTNWVRSKSYIGTVSQSKEITRFNSSQNRWGYFREKEVDRASGWTYSMMVYAPGSTPISFSVVFRNTSGTILGGRSGTLS